MRVIEVGLRRRDVVAVLRGSYPGEVRLRIAGRIDLIRARCRDLIGKQLILMYGAAAENEGSLTLLGEPGAVIEYDGSGGILGGQGVAYVAVRNFVIKGPAGDQRVVSFTAQAG